MAMAISGVREEGVKGTRLRVFERNVTDQMGEVLSDILVQFRYADTDLGFGVRVRVYVKKRESVNADVRLRLRASILDHLAPDLLSSFGLHLVAWEDWNGSDQEPIDGTGGLPSPRLPVSVSQAPSSPLPLAPVPAAEVVRATPAPLAEAVGLN